MPKDVETPTAEEIEAHNAAHVPAKMWCPACVEGRSLTHHTAESKVKAETSLKLEWTTHSCGMLMVKYD